MDIIVNLITLLFLGYIIFLLSYSMFRGAPFAALSKDRIITMFELLQPARKKLFLDIGSGDGRIVIEASKRGLISYGYEINPLLVFISRINLKKNKANGQILLKDYWREDFSKFDYVTVWGVPTMMKRLEKKLLKELKPGAKVVSNHLKFPKWNSKSQKNDVYLYIR